MVLVVEYDPAWPDQFEALRREYAAALDAAGVPVVTIEHVGSTAVPGQAAKPVIDVDIVVEQPDITAGSEVLTRLGFRPLGELGIPDRWAFSPPHRFGETNTYVVLRDSLALRNHLAVRDALRAHPRLRDEYSRVKHAVAATAAGIEEYGRGKNATVQAILAAAGLTDAEWESIAGNVVPSRKEVPR